MFAIACYGGGRGGEGSNKLNGVGAETTSCCMEGRLFLSLLSVTRRGVGYQISQEGIHVSHNRIISFPVGLCAR